MLKNADVINQEQTTLTVFLKLQLHFLYDNLKYN